MLMLFQLKTSRSHGDLIKDFEDINYDLGIGLGVYDIHSPRIPTKKKKLLQQSIVHYNKSTAHYSG